MKKSDCKNALKCGGCTLNCSYEEQKELKISRAKELFSSLYEGEINFFASREFAFRTRAEFGFWHEGNELFYTMKGKKNERIFIDDCKIVDEKISSFMPILLQTLKNDEILRAKIFGCEFISTRNSLTAILLYHRNIEEISNELEELAKELNINLIARSRKKKLVFGSEYFDEILSIDGKEFIYTLSDTGFIQPNTLVNQKMIEFALNSVDKGKDLLELYCGHGNFTLALASKFDKVLATEISKKSIELALKNCDKNDVNNIKFLRMSAEELMSAFNKEREFNRLKNINLDDYDFSHVLVDPPRAGCDETVLNLIRKIPNIIYVSCSQITLKRDLEILSKTHKIKDITLFDQFAHTDHIETIVNLELA